MYCPHCGHDLPHPIVHGISSCNNCNRVFDSSPFNLFLGTAWLVRKRHIDDEDILIHQYGYDPWIAEVVVNYVSEFGYNHEEFVKMLKEMGVCEFFTCNKSKCQMCEICQQNPIDLAS